MQASLQARKIRKSKMLKVFLSMLTILIALICFPFLLVGGTLFIAFLPFGFIGNYEAFLAEKKNRARLKVVPDYNEKP